VSEVRVRLPRLPRPTDVVDHVVRAVENLNSIIEDLDVSLRRIDEALRSADYVAMERLMRLETVRQEVPSPSYPGQSPESYCVPPDTLVVTDEGLKPISLIKEGDKVLTHRGRFRRVLKVFRRPYEGKLVKIRTWGSPEYTLLTPNHPILVRRKDGSIEWAEAGKVTKDMWLVYPVLRASYDIPAITEGLAKLIGYYLAEGSILFTRVSRRPYGIRLVFGKDERDIIEDVKQILDNLGLKYRITELQRGVEVNINNFMLASFILQQFNHGAENKRVPLWFKLLPRQKLKTMLDAYWRGDGFKYVKGRGKTRFGINSVSKQLIYDVRDIVLKLGYIPMISVKGEREVVILGKPTKGRSIYRLEFREPVSHPTYQKMVFVDDCDGVTSKILELRSKGVSVRKIVKELGIPRSTVRYKLEVATNPQLRLLGSMLFLRVRDVQTVDYEGDVYNLEVEEDHSYCLSDFVVHNCLECLYRHYTKALGLLEEAERFSLGKGEVTPEARQRVHLALKEVVTAEEDLGTPIRDPDLARMLDEIKVKQREFRKWVWAERLLTTQKDIYKLREAISRMQEVVELTRRAAEYYDSKHGECPLCKRVDFRKLFEMLCSRIGPVCYETIEKLVRGEISAKEAYEVIRREGVAKGITDEEVDRMIAEAMR